MEVGHFLDPLFELFVVRAPELRVVEISDVERTRLKSGLAGPILGYSRETLQALDRESLIRIILNLQETIRDLAASVQELKDELRRLRGEKGRPGLKPSVPDEPAEGKKRKTGLWRKSGKTITVTRRERLAIDQRILPKDAVFRRRHS